jgi:hypothetical protein
VGVNLRTGNRGVVAISQSQRADATQLHLLFATGRRPDRGAITAFAARHLATRVTHDPLAGEHEHVSAIWPGQPLWIELLRDGLTFDLSGFSPGAACEFPIIGSRFDCATLPAPETHEVLALLPGPHLAGGGQSQPVVRALLALARDLVLHFGDCEAVCWSPSRSVIGRRYFESIISAWLDGGAFPALGLTAFDETPEGALESVGLGFWTGQELRIEPPLSTDKVAATRLGVRLVNQLVLTGGITADERIVAPDGTRLVLRPSRQRSVISVWRE